MTVFYVFCACPAQRRAATDHIRHSYSGKLSHLQLHLRGFSATYHLRSAIYSSITVDQHIMRQTDSNLQSLQGKWWSLIVGRVHLRPLPRLPLLHPFYTTCHFSTSSSSSSQGMHAALEEPHPPAVSIPWPSPRRSRRVTNLVIPNLPIPPSVFFETPQRWSLRPLGLCVPSPDGDGCPFSWRGSYVLHFDNSDVLANKCHGLFCFLTCSPDWLVV